MSKAAPRKRTNVSLDARLLEEARRLELNVSAVTEAALEKAVREARARGWVEENARALAERAEWIDRNGLPLAKWQTWKP
jgi:antitoxin CcdA